MELLEGETLAERLSRGPLERDELFRCAIDMSDALTETHRQGVVHGDLKPGNVMLTSEGAKLLDFGLATLNAGATASDGSFGGDTVAATATTIGGTPAYMAPEQLEGLATDWRIDVFAFGAILFEMVTARKAFSARTGPLVATPSVVDPPLLPADVPQWARDLTPFIARCLAHDAADRWSRTLDMADELRRISVASTDVAQTRSGARRVPLSGAWWRVAGAAALLSSAVLWWAADRGNWFGPRPLPPALSSAPRRCPWATCGCSLRTTGWKSIRRFRPTGVPSPTPPAPRPACASSCARSARG